MGLAENRGVALFSRCGKVSSTRRSHGEYVVSFPVVSGCTRGYQNTRALSLRKLDRTKVYASMVLSDGDNQCLWNGPTAFMFKYMDRMKAYGQRPFAVSYTMGPSIVDLNPLAAEIVNEHLEPQDSIGGAVSGVGYMYMRYYANNFSVKIGSA